MCDLLFRRIQIFLMSFTIKLIALNFFFGTVCDVVPIFLRTNVDKISDEKSLIRFNQLTKIDLYIQAHLLIQIPKSHQ